MRYMHALRTHALLIAAVTGTALLVAVVVVATATRRYDASADLQIQALPAYGTDPFQGMDVFRQPTDGSSPTVAAARLFASPQFVDALHHRLGAQARGVTVSATPLSQADIVSLSASAPSAGAAARAANTYASVIVAQRGALFHRELQQRINQVAVQMRAVPRAGRATSPVYQTLAGELGTLRAWLGSSDPTLRLLTGATVPLAASWPRPKLTLVVALVIGLLLGVSAAVALELVNPRVTSEDELALSQRLPLLARVPRLPARVVREYLLGRSLLPADAWKGYRTLRAVLTNAGVEGGLPRSLLITSPAPGDGKTLTAVNVAITLAAANLRVTLVDADFHRPMIGTIFDVVGRQDGLVRLLRDPDAARTGTVEAPSHPRLRLLLSSREQMHDLFLFDTARLMAVLARLQQESDVVVIDSPPLPEVAEALALADASEAVVVCVRIGHTRRDKLNDLRGLLGRRGITPLGFFVTTRRRSRATASEYDYATDVITTPTGVLASREPYASTEVS